MKKERGQALVILAFALIALAAFAGLAIDGGRTYTARRQAQNTADAVALAGTRLLGQVIGTCGGVNPVDGDRAITLEMVNMALSNGIDPLGENAGLEAWYVDANEVDLGPVGWASVMPNPGGGVLASGAPVVGPTGIPDGATGIRVLLTTTDNTTFMKIVGQDEIVATGEAMAMTGPIRQLNGGVLPVGVPLEVINDLEPGEDFYIMEKNNQWGGGVFCRDPNGVDCIGEEPSNANSHRGWLNLNYIYNTEHLAASDPHYRTFEQNVANRGCGSDPSRSTDDGLKGWCEDGCPYPFPLFAGTPGFVDGDFIHGDPGARESSVMTLKNTWDGRVAYVPIFDAIYMSNYMADNFPQPEGIGWPRAGGGGHAFMYHIVGFAAVMIDGGTPKHTIGGQFQEAIVGNSQITPGAGFSSGGGGESCNAITIIGLQLWR